MFPWTSRANLPSLWRLPPLPFPLARVGMTLSAFPLPPEPPLHSGAWGILPFRVCCAFTIIAGQESIHLCPAHEGAPTSGQDHAGISPAVYKSHSDDNNPREVLIVKYGGEIQNYTEFKRSLEDFFSWCLICLIDRSGRLRQWNYSSELIWLHNPLFHRSVSTLDRQICRVSN